MSGKKGSVREQEYNVSVNGRSVGILWCVSVFLSMFLSMFHVCEYKVQFHLATLINACGHFWIQKGQERFPTC